MSGEGMENVVELPTKHPCKTWKTGIYSNARLDVGFGLCHGHGCVLRV